VKYVWIGLVVFDEEPLCILYRVAGFCSSHAKVKKWLVCMYVSESKKIEVNQIVRGDSLVEFGVWTTKNQYASPHVQLGSPWIIFVIFLFW
jgi:hypothetical protein